MSTITPGIYQHYKGGRYEIIGVAHHEETMEELVVYRALYDIPELGHNPLFVRPKNVFLQTVSVNGKEVPRFKAL